MGRARTVSAAVSGRAVDLRARDCYGFRSHKRSRGGTRSFLGSPGRTFPVHLGIPVSITQRT